MRTQAKIDRDRAKFQNDLRLARTPGTGSYKRVESALLRLGTLTDATFSARRGMTASKERFLERALVQFVSTRRSRMFTSRTFKTWLNQEYPQTRHLDGWRTGITPCVITPFLKHRAEKLGLRLYAVRKSAIWEVVG